MVRFAGLLWSLASTTSICTCTHQVSEADLHGEQRADPASKLFVKSNSLFMLERQRCELVTASVGGVRSRKEAGIFAEWAASR
ncbi:hypothetical protein DB88DRAFT_298536 [Papiliotrema laurentii]|uniref:Secreted protein n=1 Tax=Papiliotrema laurentii TaxID=5418 RepID=A0AAD9FPD6_PAPLA|nr:hypothetical protein DB88DRAFT_298536 [Papiliotrema laurentii]